MRGIETSRDSVATQESKNVVLDEFIVTFNGGSSMPRHRNTCMLYIYSKTVIVR